MSKYLIPIDNVLSLRAISRNDTLKHVITNHCNAPSRTLVIDRQGWCFVCACEAWLPITVGNISDFSSLDQVWNNPVAQSLQKEIDDRLYTHCAVDRCGILTEDNIQPKYNISINIDDSCNLKCPSCRTDMVMSTSGADFDRRSAQVDHLVNLLENFDHPCHITMTGNGDPLASSIMRPLIHRYVPRHNHTVRLFTNGLLLEKQLSTAPPILNNITQYFVSIDAGSAEVYERVRLGGQFTQLIKNLDFLKTLVEQTGAEVLLKFVLQQDNYADMQNFVDLCYHYNFRGVINRLEDWGTWNDYTRHDVIGNGAHSLHIASVENLVEIYKKYVNIPYPTTGGRNLINFNPSLIMLCKEQLQ